MNLAEKVGVIGESCTKFGESYDQSAEDMIVEAAFEAYRDSGQRGLATFNEHPVIGYGTTAPSLFAMAANRHFKTYGASRETLAKVAVKNHHNGTLSPKAHFQMDVTEAQVGLAHNLGGPGAVGCVAILANG